jgi:hypothetical protein
MPGEGGNWPPKSDSANVFHALHLFLNIPREITMVLQFYSRDTTPGRKGSPSTAGEFYNISITPSEDLISHFFSRLILCISLQKFVAHLRKIRIIALDGQRKDLRR